MLPATPQYGLVVLWFLIFTLGTLFQSGFGGAGLREQALRLVVASVVFIVMLTFFR